MKHRRLLIILLLSAVFVLAQESTKVQVSVSGEPKLKDLVSSHLRVGLGHLPDVVPVAERGKDVWHSIEVVVSWIHINNTITGIHAISVVTGIRDATEARSEPVITSHELYVGSSDDLQTQCNHIVAQFNDQMLEPIRRASTLLREKIRESVRKK